MLPNQIDTGIVWQHRNSSIDLSYFILYDTDSWNGENFEQL
jgi:hypothetical protein